MADSVKPPKRENGVIVPLVTPLTGDGKLDEPALRRLVDHVIAGGVQGVFVLGTTGEGPSAPRSMRARVVHVAADQAGKRARLYAGITDTSLADSIASAGEFRRMGAEVVVAALPGYFALNPKEQFRYLAELVENIPSPLMLYDIPATTHNPLDMAVIEHLRVFSNVVGIKDSSGSYDQLDRLLNAYASDPGFSILVGSTPLASYGLQHGADGFVPSMGNLEPGLCTRLCSASDTGDLALMAEIQARINEVTDSYGKDRTIGQAIAGLKLLLSQRGLCGKKVFPPLLELDG